MTRGGDLKIYTTIHLNQIVPTLPQLPETEPFENSKRRKLGKFPLSTYPLHLLKYPPNEDFGDTGREIVHLIATGCQRWTRAVAKRRRCFVVRALLQGLIIMCVLCIIVTDNN